MWLELEMEMKMELVQLNQFAPMWHTAFSVEHYIFFGLGSCDLTLTLVLLLVFGT